MSTDKVRGTPGPWRVEPETEYQPSEVKWEDGRAVIYANERTKHRKYARIIATAPDGVLLARKVLSVVPSIYPAGAEIRELALRIVEAVDGKTQG